MGYETQSGPDLSNAPGTNGRSVTQVLPETRRARREAKALAIIKAIPAKVEPMPELVPLIPRRPDPTYTLVGLPNDTLLTSSVIYFMYSAGRIKIGFSTGLRARHSGLKKAGSFPPVLLLVMPGTGKEERDIHARFKDDRLHGEWFRLSAKLRGYLKMRLCDTGLASLEQAEREYRDECAAFLEAYKPPPSKRRPRQLCEHGKPTYQHCQPCERARDLAILENLKCK
ncbi:GIY-YIG nuclease family protein [Bradyrhizobium sp. 8-10B]|uniref:GIY-YIG nuclease family protein n=1 Tax=Bradyrhizobium sp. 8-10B TaxID=3344579 RepID=UPI0035C181F1